MQTAIVYLALIAATGVTFYFIHRPVRQARRFEKLYNRLHWSDRI